MKPNQPRTPLKTVFKHARSAPRSSPRKSLSRLLIRSAVILLLLIGFVYVANAVIDPFLNYAFAVEG
jgi:hypothetical protein